MVRIACFALVVACLACLPHHAIGKEENLALHFTSSYGVEVKMPYFEDFHELDSDIREVVTTQFANIFSYLNTTLGDMLVGKHAGKINRIHSWKITGTLIKKGYHYVSERKRLKKQSGTSRMFGITMKPMFQRLLEGSERIEKDLKTRKEVKDPVWLERRKTRLFGSLIEALTHPDNKVAVFFDWIGSTLTDPEVSPEPLSLEKELTEVIGHLRYQGFGHVMGGIETLVSLFCSKSSKGWH